MPSNRKYIDLEGLEDFYQSLKTIHQNIQTSANTYTDSIVGSLVDGDTTHESIRAYIDSKLVDINSALEVILHGNV